jgi:ADP-heptose:LPS heptosyltransferase
MARVPGVRLFAVQKGAGREQIAEAAGRVPVVDVGAELTDFSDTAALLMHLDLVISVDTAVAHLAGALGRPVWVALPSANDWRWLRGREDSPWYPTARLFRQPGRQGDWDPVFARMEEELRVLARGRTSG